MSATDTPTASLQAGYEAMRGGDLPAAERIFAGLYEADRRNPDLLLAWGQLRRRMGDTAQAQAMLREAANQGGGPPALAELGCLLVDGGDLKQAAGLARGMLEQHPNHAASRFLAGIVEAKQGRGEAAAGHFRAASRADRSHAPSRLALARTLVGLGRQEDAARAYAALIGRMPTHLDAQMELGWLYGRLNRFDEALSCFDRAEALGADVGPGIAQCAMAGMYICDWRRRAELLARLQARLAQPAPCGGLDAYALLAQLDDPAAHAIMAGSLARGVVAAVAGLPKPVLRRRDQGPIRLGYLSGDMRAHPAALLMLGLLQAHDRAAFDVHLYSYGPNDGSVLRGEIEAAVPHFVDIAREGGAAAAARIAADGIEILVDLTGYTDGGRADIAALRPAPVAVNFLGYPGTYGAPWIDYVIADATVLPAAQQPHWVERIVHLPGCYQPNGRARPIPTTPDRAALGLPQGFVFACFNNTYKISPEVFAIWMRLLHAVPGSALWLFEGNRFVAANLRAEAARAGVAPERLVFAPPMTLEAHIARQAAADLMLDTFPYGAHTTGSDALWAGLPFVTRMGESFAARVGASLLQAVGLPELITQDFPAYEALALALAQDPARLAGYRARLVAARDTAPLFDAALFAKGFEAVLATMGEKLRGVA